MSHQATTTKPRRVAQQWAEQGVAIVVASVGGSGGRCPRRGGVTCQNRRFLVHLR